MKINTNVSIDEFLKKKAQETGLNISQVLEWALNEKLSSKKNIPEEQIKAECSICHKIVDKGYVCKYWNKVFCEDCERTWDYSKCRHDIKEVGGNLLHFHLRFGEVPEIMGKTIEDVEKGRENHIIE